MKLLSLLQGHRAEDQIGFHQSGVQLVHEGLLEDYRAVPFLGADRQPSRNPVFDEILETAKSLRPDFVFFQYFHFHQIPDPSLLIQNLRQTLPRAVFFVSSGDSFGRWTRRLPASLIQASRAVDLTFLSGMGYVADDLVGRGGQRIALMPHGFCPVRFSSAQRPYEGFRSEGEVVCVASNYRVHNPLSYLYRHKKARVEEIRALGHRYGKKFALFGRGWEGFTGWRGPLPYEKQGELFRGARVVVGGHPGGSMDYYLSDREFIAMASGTPFVEHWTPRVETLFRPGEHWYLYRNEQEMIRTIDRLLGEPAGAAKARATQTEAYLRSKHSQYHRLKEMLRIAKEYGECRGDGRGYLPKLEFFLPEVDWSREKRFALRGWGPDPGRFPKKTRQ